MGPFIEDGVASEGGMSAAEETEGVWMGVGTMGVGAAEVLREREARPWALCILTTQQK